jgi:hypothetical protein
VARIHGELPGFERMGLTLQPVSVIFASLLPIYVIKVETVLRLTEATLNATKAPEQTILSFGMQVYETVKKCVAVIPAKTAICGFQTVTASAGEGMTVVEAFFNETISMLT